MRVKKLAWVLAASLAPVVSGCGSGAEQGWSHTTTQVAPPAAAVATPAARRVRASKVLVVIEENHSFAQMKAGMPFLARKSHKYGYARHWTAIRHPSLPNYLAIAGGSTFGVTDDKAPAAHYSDIGSARSVFDQAVAAGKTARTYAQSMPGSCHVFDHPDKAVAPPRYAVRHNPWVYFKAGRVACSADDVPVRAFKRDAKANDLPDVGFLIPDLTHDAHSGSLSAADRWLRRKLTPVLASADFTRGRLVVIVTADEDDHRAGNNVLTSVLTPALHHKVVGGPLNHYSLTRYIAEVLGVTPLGKGRTAPDLKTAFGLS
ncbi:MAG: phosphatidylinositol-3-phosphatase [Nocardioidaceae bacterium]|jgi:acid phosphatase|nr:phosphatidylinositol-3-phosphatase [Nocardioidaceae bacterium]